MSVLVLFSPPGAEPLTTADVVRQLGLVADDPRIEGFIRAARQSLEGEEGWLGRALITQTWDLYLDAFPCGEVRLPFPPLQTVEEIAVADASGAEEVVPSSSYRVLKGATGRIVPISSWPPLKVSAQGVRIRFVAGYGDSGADIEKRAAPILQAMVLMVGRMIAASRADMAMRSRTVDGVGSMTWMNPSDVREGITATEDALLNPFRIWA